MAAPEAVAPPPVTEVHNVEEDDDAWLYGDEGKEKEQSSSNQDKAKSGGSQTAQPKGEGVMKKEDREEGEMSGEEGESQEKDDDDDSDDDNVQVTIGDIKAWSATEQQPRNLFKSGTSYQKPATGTPAKPAATTKGLDIEAQGTINGVPVYEFDINTLENEEKPWRKPGADITDYFNYGFTEETWQQYCEKQRRLISMNEGAAKTVSNTTSSNISIISRADKDLGVSRPRVVVPPPVVSKAQVGTIDVIGGTAKDSRRPDEGDPIPVAGVATHIGRKFTPMPGLPPTSIPPPHLPPVDYSIPPPGLPPPPHTVPPPGMGVMPPGFPPVANPYDPFYAVPPLPDRSMPPPAFEDRPPFTYAGPAHPTFSNTFSDATRPPSQPWDTGSTVSEQESRDRDWDRDRERREGTRRDRERSPSHRLEEEFGREVKYRTHERERERERDRDRERERDRDRKRDRDVRRRSRSAERDRDTDSSRRDRDDDKHRSRRSDARRHKGDDSDTESRSSSSKHKKSRRRRDKDDAGAEGDETPSKGD